MKIITKKSWITVTFATFFLFFPGTSMSYPMQQFIQAIKNRKPNPVQPIPEFKKFEAYPYKAQDIRSPFEPFVTSIATKPLPMLLDKGPDLNRPRELLESYPLDALKMVGTLARGPQYYALVKDNHNIIHRVNVGNYLGQNFGIIQKISETNIEILEWAVTATENYEERKVIIHLSPN